MPVPTPPVPLPRPNVATLPEDMRLHRVHLRSFDGAAFNPCVGGPTRFAPLHDARGECIPTLYAGSTLAAAVFETLLHDIPVAASLKTVPRLAILARAHSVLRTRRVLALAELRAPDLHLWGLARNDLVAAPPTDYASSALWALAAHEAFPELDGLRWTSNRCDPDDALLLFGSRCADAVEVEARRDGADLSFLEDVHEIARRAGIVVTL